MGIRPERNEKVQAFGQVCNYEDPISSYKYQNQISGQSGCTSGKYDYERSSTYSRSDCRSQESKSITRDSSNPQRQNLTTATWIDT